MARIHCQVIHKPGRITLIWSDGAAAFEPYHLVGYEHETFCQAGQEAQFALGLLLDKADPRTEDALKLAQAGHRLYRAIFRLDAPEPGVASEIRTWLHDLDRQQGIETLEILSDSPGRIPWNTVYEAALVANTSWVGAFTQQSFWGLRYNLAVGRRVNALRHVTWPEAPTVVVVVDESAHDASWSAWAEDRQATMVRTRADLEERFAKASPDVVVIEAPVVPDGFLLANQRVTVDDIKAMLAGAEEGNPDPLIVFQPSDKVDAEECERLLGTLVHGLNGVLTSETLTSPSLSGEFWRKALGDWLTNRQSLGKALREARQSLGLAGLAFSAFCPAHLRVPDPGEEAQVMLPPLNLPDQPYRSVSPFDRGDRALFIGREDDVVRFAGLLDEPGTRGLLLHGSSGCGKTSFLQAGVFPFVEEEAVGFQVLRQRIPGDQPTGENEYPVQALRPGVDLAGQIAQGLAAFCAQPYSFTTPTNRTVSVNLPALLADALGLVTEPGDLRTAIQADVSTGIVDRSTTASPEERNDEAESGLEETTRRLWQLLSSDDSNALTTIVDHIARDLPFELILWLEQGEELVTLATDPGIHRSGLAQLDGLLHSRVRCKVVLSARTDFLGRILDLLPHGLTPAWREFYLSELDREQVINALLLPAANQVLPRCVETPAKKYGFTFAPGLVDGLVEEARTLARQRFQPALANLQALFTDLVQRSRRRREAQISRATVKELKGVDGALARHVDRRLGELSLLSKDQNRLRELIHRLGKLHPDGTVTRTLLHESQAVEGWAGDDSAAEAIGKAEGAGLLQIHGLISSGMESLYVGLPQDALARLNADAQEQQRTQARVRSRNLDFLWFGLPLLLLACVVTWVLARRSVITAKTEPEDEKIKEIARGFQKQVDQLMEQSRPPLYNATIAQADQAIKGGDALRARQLLLGLQPLQGQADLRSFEWHYLWRRINGHTRMLAGHQGAVVSVAVSPNGKLIASASTDGLIKLWNAEKGEENATLKGHTGPVYAVVFSPDGKSVVSAGADKTIRVWDAAAGAKDHQFVEKELKKLTGHTDAVLTLAFGKDTSILASAGADKTVILWNLDQGKEGTTWKDHTGAVHALAWTLDGKSLASAGADQAILIRDVADKKVTQTIKTAGPIHGLSFSADGKLLASGGVEPGAGIGQGVARVWETATGKLAHGPFLHGTRLVRCAFTSDNSLLTSGRDFVVRQWDLSGGEEKSPILGHYGWVEALTLAADGVTLVTGSHDQTLKTWNLLTSHNPMVVFSGSEPVTNLAMTTKGDLLTWGSLSGTVKLVDTATGRAVTELPGPKGAILSVALSTDEKNPKLAAGSATGEIKLWELSQSAKEGWKAKELATLKEHGKEVLALAFSNDGKILVSAGADQLAVLWDATTGKVRNLLRGHGAAIRGIAFHFNGKALATGDDLGLVRSWDVGTGRDLGPPYKVSPGPITGLDLFLTGGITSVGEDGFLRLMQLVEGEDVPRQRALRLHGGPILALTRAKVSDMYVTAGQDGAIQVCHPILGQRLALTGHVGAVRALALSGDGKLLASAGQDGTIRLWRVAEREFDSTRKADEK